MYKLLGSRMILNYQFIFSATSPNKSPKAKTQWLGKKFGYLSGHRYMYVILESFPAIPYFLFLFSRVSTHRYSSWPAVSRMSSTASIYMLTPVVWHVSSTLVWVTHLYSSWPVVSRMSRFSINLQWLFVNRDTFVPCQYFRINEFSGLLNRPSVQKRKSVPTLFVRISRFPEYRIQD